MEYIFVALIAVVAVGIWVAVVRNSKQVERRQARELEGALAAGRSAAEEDVTRFGEELQAVDLSGSPLDAAARQDYERALDCYENAKQSLAAVTRPDEVRHVTEILSEGRYAVACLQARVTGEPLPAKRPPCFFDPSHGPSAQNVDWAPPGQHTRSVPACAADAERVLAGGIPYIRTVLVGARRVPYWEAGQEYAPWAEGYFAGWRGSDLIKGVAVGSAVLGGLVVLPKLLDGLGDLVEDAIEGGALGKLKDVKDLFD